MSGPDWYAQHWERCAGLKTVFSELRRLHGPAAERFGTPNARFSNHLEFADMLDMLRYCGDRPQSIREITHD